MSKSVGRILKAWRKQRRYSQLQLALELNISSKHVSFIETGRSYPSKKMILKIGEFLFLPKREINRALYSAGYSQIYTELSITHKALKPVANAIDQMLANHMPYPAIVLNQSWDIVKANDSANKLLFDLGFSDHKNLVEALISDEQVTSKIINWHEVTLAILMRLRQEITMLGDPNHLQELEKRLSTCLAQNEEIIDVDEKQVVVSIKIQLPSCVLSLFSIVAQLSTVQDVTVSEFKVELMFPADESTKEFYDLL